MIEIDGFRILAILAIFAILLSAGGQRKGGKKKVALFYDCSAHDEVCMRALNALSRGLSLSPSAEFYGRLLRLRFVYYADDKSQ